MMSYDFTTRTTGKWILTGEHAVVRGHPAVVFPMFSRHLDLFYQASRQPLSIQIQEENTSSLLIELSWKIIHASQALLNLSDRTLTGQLSFQSNLPLGGGMGASAALCLAIARWLNAVQWIDSLSVVDFAKTLEDLFHGKSSGLDLAGVAAETGILFQKQQCRKLNLQWKPLWYLSFSGQSSATLPCVQKVQDLFKRQPEQALSLDKKMVRSVEQACLALEKPKSEGMSALIKAIQLGEECFRDWGLLSSQLDAHMNLLMEAGALAVKPTGSGLGGYVLSIWEEEPPAALLPHLIFLQI